MAEGAASSASLEILFLKISTARPRRPPLLRMVRAALAIRAAYQVVEAELRALIVHATNVAAPDHLPRKSDRAPARLPRRSARAPGTGAEW